MIKKERPAKVGTQPWLIVIDGRCKVLVGRRVIFRKSGHGEKWMHGVITQINEDGFLFIDPIGMRG